MSKYYKAEDIDNAIREAHAEAESNEICKAMFHLHCVVSDLPTIEVSEEELKGCEKVDKRFSEDCISRADLLKTIEDNVSQQHKDSYGTYGLGLWALFVRIVENAPSIEYSDNGYCHRGERTGK